MDPQLAATLERAIEAIRQDRPMEAHTQLQTLLGDSLSPALRARALGLSAQALLLLGRADEAAPVARKALSAARALDDVKGVEQIRALYTQIYARMAEDARARQLAEEESRAVSAPLEELLAAAQSPEERVMAMVRKVNALAEAGTPDPALGQRAVDASLTLHGAPREQVLALLALARSSSQKSELYERALAIADEADETALAGAVARAARADGIAFEPKIFGS